LNFDPIFSRLRAAMLTNCMPRVAKTKGQGDPAISKDNNDTEPS
jgi:hypothetical protein